MSSYQFAIFQYQERSALITKICDIIVLYSMLQKKDSLSTMTQLLLLMSSSIAFVERSRTEPPQSGKERVNPLWILDDLKDIGARFAGASQLEISCLFLPDMVTNVKQFLFILGKLDMNSLSRRERTLCSNSTQSILATLESYFQRLHDGVRPKTVCIFCRHI